MQPDKAKTGHTIKFKNTSFLWFAIILLFGVAYVLYANRVMSDLARDFLEDLIYDSTDTFSQNISAKMRYVETIAAVDIMKDESIQFENKLKGLESVIEHAGLTRLLLIDQEGNGVTNSGERVHISNREYYDKALNGESSMTYPMATIFDEPWVIVIAVPVLDEEFQVIAVLAAGINVDGFASINRNVGNLYGSNVHILGRNFDYALELKTKDGQQEIKFIPDLMAEDGYSESRFITELIKEHEFTEGSFGYAEYIYEGISKYLLYVPVEGTDFILATTIEKDAIFKEIRAAVTLNNSLTLFILIVLSAVVYYNMALNNAIKLQQEKTALAVDVTKLLIIEVDRTNNTVISFNDNMLILSGYQKNELLNKNVLELPVGLDVEGDVWAYLDDIMSKNPSTTLEIPIYRKDGTTLYAMWKVNCSAAGMYEFFGSDISELKKSQEQIHELAYFDQLTGLYNRISLEGHIKKYLQKNDAKFAYILIDIDNFKHVNDRFDHSLGDGIIALMADRITELNKTIPDADLSAYRISSDEFVIIYQDFKDYGEVGDYSNKVYNTVCQEYKLEKIKITVTVSIGLSLYPEYAHNFQEVFKTAEIALINAKELGKSRAIFFSKKMRKEFDSVSSMILDLEEALKKKEFVLYYQPQYDIQTGEIYGFEALMRWVSPKRGLLMPNVFIPYAERNQLINKMGVWAVEEAARFSNDICKLGYGNLKISVNISVIQLLDEDFVENIIGVLERTKAKVENICFEITESVLMESVDTGIMKIKKLNDVGVKFALDDFGKGYSSLTHLTRLPVETLKIDKSFIDTLLDDKDFDNRKIIKGIIDLAHTIDLKVVAEGVEEQGQWDWLRDRGCDICQGYYKGRPLPRPEAIQRLRV